jgi:hypothetical protein
MATTVMSKTKATDRHQAQNDGRDIERSIWVPGGTPIL